jgi:hypothetical protein
MMSYTMSCTDLVVERVDVDAAHVAVHPDHRRQAGRQVQVRGLVLDREGQQLGDVHAMGNRRESRKRRGVAVAGILSAHYGDSIGSNLQEVKRRITQACTARRRPVQSVTLLA